MKALKTKVSITIDNPVLDAIKALAEQQDRSVSSYINIILREHLEKVRSKE